MWDFKTVFTTLSNIWDEAFCENTGVIELYYLLNSQTIENIKTELSLKIF